MKHKNQTKPENKTLLKLIALYQIAGGVIGLGFTAKFIPQLQNPAGSTWLGIGIAALLYTFSILSGLLLIRKPRTGLLLSFINQIAQVLSFSAAGIAFNYVAGLKLGVGVDFVETLAFKFRVSLSSFQFSVNGNPITPYITVNLLALILIYLLESHREEINATYTK